VNGYGDRQSIGEIELVGVAIFRSDLNIDLALCNEWVWGQSVWISQIVETGDLHSPSLNWCGTLG
jgi:hypothetical protein